MEREERYLFTTDKYAVKLCAHYNYPRANAWQHLAVCNGAGPRRFGGLVPDTFWGLCITESADNHDWDYGWGQTIQDKQEADRTFRNNMQRQAEALRAYEAGQNPGWLRRKYNEYRHLRRLEMIEVYFKAVDTCGGSSFWDKEYVGFSWKDIA